MTVLFTEQQWVNLGFITVALSMFAAIFRVFFTQQRWSRDVSYGLFAVSFASFAMSLLVRSLTAKFFALSNMYESLLVYTLGFQLAFLILERWFNLYKLTWGVCLVVLGLMFYGSTLPVAINPLVPALQSYWRSIHVPPLLTSYGLFTLAFLSSVTYLARDFWQNRHGGTPALAAIGDAGSLQASLDSPLSNDGALALDTDTPDLYDEVTYRCIAAGVPLLTVGILLGALWANEAWGNYWSWDPKESMSLVTLLGYGVYLHMRVNGDHSKRTLAIVSVVGFLLVIATYIGVNMYGFGSLHSYGMIKK